MKKQLAICAAVATMAASIYGQAQQTKVPTIPENIPSRVDLFAGYSYWQPHGMLNGIPFTNSPGGMLFSGSYFFNRWTGLEAEGERHWENSRNGMRGYSLGPIFRFPSNDGTSLFAHALVGGVNLTGPNLPTVGGSTFFYNPATWGVMVTAGGGADLITGLFNHHLAIRLMQADYQYLHVNFGPVQPTSGGRANLDALRLSAGLMYRFGSVPLGLPIAYSCSANPESIYAGDPVTVTGTATNMVPKRAAAYSWTGGDGVHVTGDSSTGNIETANLGPGAYTVTGHVSQGAQAGRAADCTASFTVKQFEPPAISCAANPSTLRAGDSATITANGVSPQNRTLTYSFSASAGAVSGSDNTASLNTAGAPTGPLTVTCAVQDDKGQKATATTTVTVEAPPVAPAAPATEALCSIQFDKDSRRPARVDNEAKACLDGVALNAQRQPDTSLVVVSNAAPAKSRHHYRSDVQLSAQRAVNTKDYLVKEKGIDASRIQVRTGRSGANEVENYLVPSGASFDDDAHGTTTVDEQRIKAQPRNPRGRHADTSKKR